MKVVKNLIFMCITIILIGLSSICVYAYDYSYDSNDFGDMFKVDSTHYSRELAVISSEFSEVSESPSCKELVKAFENYGVEDTIIRGFEDTDNSTTLSNSYAHAVGLKKLNDGSDVIVVVARGTQFGYDMVSDVAYSAPIDFLGYGVHLGVHTFYMDIYNSVSELIRTNKDLDGEYVKFLVTGHSLGGASANLLAASLTDMARKASFMDKEGIYCYTFGALSPIMDGTQVSEGYENIHNIYNLKDTFAPGGAGNFTLVVSKLGNGTGRFGHRETFTYDIKDYKSYDDDNIFDSYNHRSDIYTEYVKNKRKDIKFNCEHTISQITSEPRNISYKIGDKFDSNDIHVLAYYDYSESVDISKFSNIDTRKVDFNKVGEYVADITYDGFYTGLVINIEESKDAEVIGDFPSKLVYDSSFVNAYGYGDIVLDGTLVSLVSVTSSNKKIIDKCTFETVGDAILIDYNIKRAGTSIITIEDSYGNKKDCTVVVKKSYFTDTYIISSDWNYGERKVKVQAAKNSKIALAINGDKYKAITNSRGEAVIKVSKDYKYKSVYKITSKLKGVTKTQYSSIGTNTYARATGTVNSNSNVISFRLADVHEGDVLTVKTNNQIKKYKIYSDYPNGIDVNVYMNNAIGRTPYIKYTVKNKFGQKLFESQDNVTW